MRAGPEGDPSAESVDPLGAGHPTPRGVWSIERSCALYDTALANQSISLVSPCDSPTSRYDCHSGDHHGSITPSAVSNRHTFNRNAATLSTYSAPSGTPLRLSGGDGTGSRVGIDHPG